ncbi:MAG: stage III sporulation protein AF [Peptococcaceae bacterium]|nr:stage III sporulation protein AF [Peptococcaceae bacterium]
MDAIRSLVQNIIIILILALFLEMFLPQGGLKKYVKMVMGLLVVIAVIQAIGTLVQWDYSRELSALTAEGDRMQASDVIEAGKKMSGNQQQKAIEQYEGGIARQVIALTSLYQDTPVVDVDVRVQAGSDEPDFGQIKEIVLYVAQTGDTVPVEEGDNITLEQIKPVAINVEDVAEDGVETALEITEPPRDVVSGLVKTVAGFYSLEQQQVKVRYR